MGRTKQPLIANILSIILHPLLMTSYSICLLFVYADFSFVFGGQILRFMLPVVLLSCIIPGLGLFFLKQSNFIVDYDNSPSKNRMLILIITAFPYFLLYYYFSQTVIFSWFLGLTLAPFILLVINAIINIWGRLSLPMVGIGGLIGSGLSVCYNVKHLNPFVLFIILFILAGALATLRLYMRKDTSLQVYSGFLLGLVVSSLCIWAGANFFYLFLLIK